MAKKYVSKDKEAYKNKGMSKKDQGKSKDKKMSYEPYSDQSPQTKGEYSKKKNPHTVDKYKGEKSLPKNGEQSMAPSTKRSSDIKSAENKSGMPSCDDKLSYPLPKSGDLGKSEV